jgi:hypothetical protein
VHNPAAAEMLTHSAALTNLGNIRTRAVGVDREFLAMLTEQQNIVEQK